MPTGHQSGNDHTVDDAYNKQLSQALYDAKMSGMGSPTAATLHYGTMTFLVKKFGTIEAAIKYVKDGMVAFAKEMHIDATYYSVQVGTHNQFENWLKAHAAYDVPLNETFYGH